MEKAIGRGLDWAGLPVIATVARLLCRELTRQNEYLRLENRILKEKVTGRLRFTDEERRSLMRMSGARETALRALRGTDEFLDTTAVGGDHHRLLLAMHTKTLPQDRQLVLGVAAERDERAKLRGDGSR